jgi:eukaryotic-like serine/threonine-protein kinase
VPAEGGIRFGQYVLLRRIARGGMAEVFLAQQRGLEGFDRRVAVKRILPHLVDSPDFVKMFLGEAKLAAQLTHPNVVHIYDFGKVDSDYFIAMEYVDGVHAGQVFKQQSGPERMSPTMIARLGADAAAALHHAHELRGPNGMPYGIVHRDVSPANLMVSYDGVVKLCDFGIAKAAALSDQRTNPGQVKGKYAYMSPEQTIAAPLDGRSDVFSLAIVLWELLVGKPIVPRGDAIAAMRAIRDGKLPPLTTLAPGTPAPLARAVMWGLETKREQRATAADLSTALEAFIKASPELATPMQVAAWVRARFPRESTGLTGPRQAIRDGRGPTPPIGTVVVAPGTVAAQTGTRVAPVTPPQQTMTPSMVLESDETSQVSVLGDPDGKATILDTKRSVSARITTRATTPPRNDATLDDPALRAALETADRDGASVILAGQETIVRPDAGRPFAPPPISSVPTLLGTGARRVPLPQIPTGTQSTKDVRRRVPRPLIIAAALVGVAVASFLIALAASSNNRQAAVPDAAAAAIIVIDAAPAPITPPPADAPQVAVAPPADAAAPAPSPSLYKVDTSPKGGTIRIGDQRRAAPAQFALAPGKHTVFAELDGWHGEKRVIEIFAGVDLVQEISFDRKVATPPPPKSELGTLTVRTTPYSDVYIGTRKIGEAPFADYPLPPGTYTLVFKNPNHPSVRKTVTIVAGKLTKLPAFSLPER